MKSAEYEKELKFLYGKAVEQKNVHLALEILERSRTLGIDNIREPENETKVS